MSQTWNYIYRIQPTRPAMLTEGPTPVEQDAVGRHFQYLEKLTAQGVVFLAGRTPNRDPSSFGIVIFRAESEEEARGIMEGDPAIRQDVMKGELFPFGIALLGEP